MSRARLWIGGIIMGIVGLTTWLLSIIVSLISSSMCDVQEWAKFYVFMSGSVFGFIIAVGVVLALGWLLNIPQKLGEENE